MNPHLLVRHKVEDLAKWKDEFDEGQDRRNAAGTDKGHLFVNADDPSEVFVLLRMKDFETMREYMNSEDPRRSMEEAGVVGKADVFFLDEVAKLDG